MEFFGFCGINSTSLRSRCGRTLVNPNRCIPLAGLTASRNPFGQVSIRSTTTFCSSRCGNGVVRCWFIVWRVVSNIAPYSTPLGQTASQARQPKQRSIWVATLSVSGIFPSSNPRIKWMRPRGESFSFPVSRNVGQDCKQSPQWTQASDLLRSRNGGS